MTSNDSTKPSTWGVIPDAGTPAGTRVRNINTEMTGIMTMAPGEHGTLGWDAFGAETFGQADQFRIYDPAYYDDAPAPVHWHYGHNVSGYLPMSDDPDACETWHDAMASLVDELDRAWDDGSDDDYLDAHTAMHGATEGQDFLTYTATNPDSDHDIPTAWWVTSCGEDGCLAGDDQS